MEQNDGASIANETPHVVHDTKSKTTSYSPSKLRYPSSEHAYQQSAIADVPGRR
jgi:hypothetical protein